MKRVGIFIMAYEAVSTLIAAYERIPAQLKKDAAEIYIIDDASEDNTFWAGTGYKLLHNIPNLNVYRNPRNLGYGGNQKRGLRHAIENRFKIVGSECSSPNTTPAFGLIPAKLCNRYPLKSARISFILTRKSSSSLRKRDSGYGRSRFLLIMAPSPTKLAFGPLCGMGLVS